MGISGINSSFDNSGEKLSVSPTGYVFDQSGTMAGQALPLTSFYTPFGTVSSYLGLNGQAQNASGTAVGRVMSSGFIINSQNQLTATDIKANLAVSASGGQLGILGGENVILNKSLSPTAKILPDGSVSEIGAGSLNYMPKLGEAYATGAALDFNGTLLGYVDNTGNVNN